MNPTNNKSKYAIGDIYVPDEGNEDSKIVFVGEAPGETEEFDKRPFVGAAGSILINCLMRNGFAREEVRLANLCHFRPQYNKFETLLGTSVLQSGIEELKHYITTKRPNVIVALGNWPMHILTGKGTGHAGISAWRGSILQCEWDKEIKVIPTYHPSYIVRQRTDYPIFDQDIKRAIMDCAFRDFRYPQRNIVIDPKDLAVEEWTQRLCEAPLLSCDIESVKNSTHILCVGFSPDPNTAVVFPYTEYNQQFIDRILRSQAKKIFHFGIFDTEMLYINGHEVNNYTHDTLVMQHVLQPELPQSLDYITSIYTREPYYKSSGRADIPKDQKSWSLKTNRNNLYRYNGKDCCCTFECFIPMYEELKQAKTTHIYEYKMELIPAFGSIGRAGLPIDRERHALLKKSLTNRYSTLQFLLEKIVGHECNVRSPKLKDLLYNELKLPARRNREGALTTDEDAIVSLIGFVKNHIAGLKTDRTKFEWERKLSILTGILKIRGVRQLISVYLNARISDDGRIRSTYKPAGPETGRSACQKYVDGSGFNAQTMPREAIEVMEAEMAATPVISIDENANDDDDEDIAA